MSQIDVNEQWRRLQQDYTAMADEELAAIAKQAYDLTDIARQALQAEISRRHVTIELKLQTPRNEEVPAYLPYEEPFPEDPSFEDEFSAEERQPPRGYPAGFDPEDWELVSFTHVDDVAQGSKLKQCFDEAGIPSYYGPEVVDDLRLLQSSFKGSLEVKVREVDLARAIAVRNRCTALSVDEEPEEISDYSVHCPKCHSSGIVFRKLETEQDGGATKFSWSCDACGYQWKDDGIESEG